MHSGNVVDHLIIYTLHLQENLEPPSAIYSASKPQIVLHEYRILLTSSIVWFHKI